MKQLSKLVWSTIAAFALVVATGSPAAAQSKQEIGVGYQFMSLSSGGASSSVPAGWFFDYSRPLPIQMVSLVISVDGGYKSDTVLTTDISSKTHTFLGGIKYSLKPSGKITPFITVTGGIGHSSSSVSPANALIPDSSSNDGALDIGGGVNYGLNDKWTLRLGAGYRRIMSTAGVNGFRLNVGVVFPIGG